MQQEPPGRAGDYTAQTSFLLHKALRQHIRGEAQRRADGNPTVASWRPLCLGGGAAPPGPKRKPERTGASLSPKSTAHDTGAAGLRATQRCGWSHLPHSIGFGPTHLHAGSPLGSMLRRVRHSPKNKGELEGRWYPRTLCDPFLPLRWPLWKGSYHQPQQPLIFPICTCHGVSSRDPQPGSNCGGEGDLGLSWWEGASMSPRPLLCRSWVLGTSAGGTEHFPYPDFAV